MNTYSLFFLAMLFQVGLAQDVGCVVAGAIANSIAPVFQEILNNRLGGVEQIEGLLAAFYDSYEISFQEPTFDGCEVTVSEVIKVNGVSPIPDLGGSATIKGTFDPASLLEGQVCVTDLEVTELDIENVPPAFQDLIDDAILGSLDIPDTCVPLPGKE